MYKHDYFLYRVRHVNSKVCTWYILLLYHFITGIHRLWNYHWIGRWLSCFVISSLMWTTIDLCPPFVGFAIKDLRVADIYQYLVNDISGKLDEWVGEIRFTEQNLYNSGNNKIQQPSTQSVHSWDHNFPYFSTRCINMTTTFLTNFRTFSEYLTTSKLQIFFFNLQTPEFPTGLWCQIHLV